MGNSEYGLQSEEVGGWVVRFLLYFFVSQPIPNNKRLIQLAFGSAS